MGTKPCNCQPGAPCGPECTPATETPGGVHSDFVSAPVLASGGTGNTLDPRAPFTRLVPGGAEWGSAPDWVGFWRPVQNLNRQFDRVSTVPEAVGFHLHRTYVEPATGTAVSLMGEPTGDGHMFPAGDMPHGGYEFAVGRPR